MTTIRELWRRHIAWRFTGTATYERKARATVVLREAPIDGSTCLKCHRQREDGRFKLCQRCRTMASLNSKRRRTRLALKGACVKCGHARDSDHVVCSPCRSAERARYRARADTNPTEGMRP